MGRPAFLVALALAVAAPHLSARPPQAEELEPGPPLLEHAALVARMRALASEHPDLVATIPLGRSREGREILALRLSHGEPPPGQPALLVVANLDGPQVFTSGLALWEAEAVARGAASGEARASALLEGRTVYVVPRANPDGAEAYFQRPRQELRATGSDVDQDRDGRSGEDGPEDVDGDGVVAWMRVPDPDGAWTEDPSDARATIEADRSRGERGRWRLEREGLDRDGDERASEDPARDAVVARNFPHGWVEHAPESGRFPLDEPEARALADFLLRHPDVALVLTYGELDNLVEKPKSVKEDAPFQKRLPPAGMLEPDAKLLEELGRRYADATGSKTKGSGDPAGSFQEWIHHHRGLTSLAVVVWDIPLDAKPEKDGKPASKEAAAEAPEEADATEEAAPEPKKKAKGAREASDEAKRLMWIDAQGESDRFLPWKDFEHPELGPVQIGGLAPYARTDPPDADRLELAQAQLDFLLGLGEVLPRAELAELRAKALGGELVEVEAVLVNPALLPLRTAAGRRTEAVRPARVRIVLPEGARLVAGEPQALVDLEGMGGRRELRWLVAGAPPGAIEVEVDSDHAGTARRSPEVER